MIESLVFGKITWVNLKNPTEGEVTDVAKTYAIPISLTGDLLKPVPRNYAFDDGNFIKISMDFPVVKRIDIEHPYEIKFIIGKHILLTVQYEEMEALDKFKKQCEVLTTLGKTSKKISPTHLFFSLMNELYATSSSKLDYLESTLSDIEADIFKDNEKQMVIEIAKANKRLIAYRHTLRAHEDIFLESEPIFQNETHKAHYSEFKLLEKSYLILKHRANALFETLNAIRAANDSMLNTKQNETIKTLTIMAFITFPLTLFSSMFGMNTEATPIIGHSHDFWIIVSIMTFATIFFFTFFKYKNWM